MFKPSDIEHISINSNIALSSNSEYLFARLYNLQDIAGLDKVDTGKVEDADYMFFNDKKLIQLGPSSWEKVLLIIILIEEVCLQEIPLKKKLN